MPAINRLDLILDYRSAGWTVNHLLIAALHACYMEMVLELI